MHDGFIHTIKAVLGSLLYPTLITIKTKNKKGGTNKIVKLSGAVETTIINSVFTRLINLIICTIYYLQSLLLFEKVYIY